MHLVIVEDDSALARVLGEGLRAEGYDVEWFGDGDAALSYAATRRPDLMILDLGLPGKDGIQVLAEMRERHWGTSVLVLTGRGDTEQKVKCLRLGADDVVVKPFSFQELRARCHALLRRRELVAGAVLRHGDLELNRLERRVTQAGREVDLTATEFSLLESLMRRGGRCCSRADLLREVWQAIPETPMGTNIVEVYINYLRKKLGMNQPGRNARPSPIRTVRGVGYQLAISVSAADIDAEGYQTDVLAGAAVYA